MAHTGKRYESIEGCPSYSCVQSERIEVYGSCYSIWFYHIGWGVLGPTAWCKNRCIQHVLLKCWLLPGWLKWYHNLLILFRECMTVWFSLYEEKANMSYSPTEFRRLLGGGKGAKLQNGLVSWCVSFNGEKPLVYKSNVPLKSIGETI